MRAMCFGLALGLSGLSGVALAETKATSNLPSFDLKDLQGKSHRSADLRGQVAVVSFWATWCLPCLQELEFLQGFYVKYQDKGFKVLAIATDGPETQSQVRSIARRRKWTFPVLLDSSGTATSLLNPRGATPYTLFVDRQGAIVRAQEGFSSGDETRHQVLIEELLASPVAAK